jgi:glycerol-3-phosphate dehydrogenase
MAEDCVDQAATLAQLPERACVTHDLRIHGYDSGVMQSGTLAAYGADSEKVRGLIAENPALSEILHPKLPYLKAEVVWAAREELARTIEDVLARRTRALFLNAAAASEMAPAVASLLAAELGWDDRTKENQVSKFREVARNYLPP